MIEPISLFSIPLFYYFVVLAFILPKIPVIGKFFNIINTAIHELGHALMTLFLQGNVKRIELFDTSAGTTTSQSKNKLSAFFIAIAGYPFASFFSLFAFYLYVHGYYLHLLIGLSTLFFIMLLFWIRNSYGIIWVLLFVAINATLLYFDYAQSVRIAVLFYVVVMLTESVWSSLVVLFLSIVRPNESGDAMVLQKITHIPAFVWGLFFAACAGFVGWKVVMF
ncbi:M50 family metallopeptidase [Bacteroidales bacterium OttesenSCG-928-B11]|nr:M50 family metallopeptidase [Bacteroidales bacterium OttesenSCG-928-E04]MDL2308198.1 M50 family metallopeptidase [Bacteroidales bacterium OttesenSCG-928-C03]MDL2312588.1 M50 family metallopeptidase [Bacteroidales bacterium OttesenSCG-928-B11]MDL2325636.1 M50 family metallopeptidase [Bacteroidales bacterium OttesenSCG-928-A14]